MMGLVRTPEPAEGIPLGDEYASSAPCYPRVLVFTTLFPNPGQPRMGVFVRHRVAAVARRCPTRVVAPVLSRPWARKREPGCTAVVPAHEQQGGLEVGHPRFMTLAPIGRFADAALLFVQSLPHVRRLRAEFPFDLIDAHYAFPDGAAAVLLGAHFGVPVCVTLRGGDIDVLARFRLRRRIIRLTLERADRVFAVSQYLAASAARLGRPRERIQVVANGVDPDTFSFLEREAARRYLGIPDDTRLLVCVADIEAEKGQHILIEALARLRANGEPSVQLVNIGNVQWGRATFQRQVEKRARELGVSDHIQMLGSKPQAELRVWYGAADVVVHPSFREGCPNVVREAQACGAPVVASRVGGVPELVTSEDLGLLVDAGDASGLADALGVALQRRWDRRAIARIGGQRTWATVGSALALEFRALVRSAPM